ncbi:hypothetical protein CLONEX_03485, partial [[Clostridium] nexile DSM 1787]
MIFDKCQPQRWLISSIQKKTLRHKDIPLPDFEKIHEQMIQMGKHADLSFLWIDYKKEHPNGYQLAQFYKLYRDFMVDTYGT